MATYYFIGGTSGAFSNAANWSATSGGTALASLTWADGDTAVIDPAQDTTATVNWLGVSARINLKLPGTNKNSVVTLNVDTDTLIGNYISPASNTTLALIASAAQRLKIAGHLRIFTAMSLTNITGIEFCGSGSQAFYSAYSLGSLMDFAAVPFVLNKTTGSVLCANGPTSGNNATTISAPRFLSLQPCPELRLNDYAGVNSLLGSNYTLANSTLPFGLAGDCEIQSLVLCNGLSATHPTALNIPSGATLKTGSTSWGTNCLIDGENTNTSLSTAARNSFGTYCTTCTDSVQDDADDTNYNVGANITKGCRVTGPPQLTAPTINQVLIAGCQSAAVLFDAVTGASSYKVRYSTTDPQTGDGEAYTSNYPIRGLTADTLYYFQIQAVGDGTTYSDSEWSTAQSATTLTSGNHVVLTNLDSASVNAAPYGTLRMCIHEFSDSNESITFDPSLSGQTITLVETLYQSVKVNIDGSALEQKVTISGGNTFTNDVSNNDGCQIFDFSPSTARTSVVRSLILTNGYAATGAGASYGVFYNCEIKDCVGTSNGGGAYGATLNNCLIHDNVGGGSGGGLANGTANDSAIYNNSAYNGGGSYDSTLNDCELYNNTSETTGGGAQDGTLIRCILHGNSATGNGAACEDLTAKNCLIYGHTTGSFACHATWLTNCTIAYNTAGGVNTEYDIKNSIIVENTPDAGTTFAYCGNSVISSSATLYLTDAGNADDDNVIYDSALPLFMDAANNDYTLASGSQAIGIGGNEFVAEGDTDLAGNTRIVGTKVDAGCYESQVILLEGLTLSESSPIENATVSATIAPSGSTYTLQWSRCATSNGTFEDISGTTSASYTPESGDIGYFLRCSATGTGVYTGTITATTASAVVYQAPVLEVNPSGATDVTPTFTAIPGCIYSLQYTSAVLDGEPDWENYILESPCVSGDEITGLTTNTTYYFRLSVADSNNANASAWSEIESATPGMAILQTPTNITATADSQTQISVAFTPAEHASSTKLQYVESDTAPDWTAVTPTTLENYQSGQAITGKTHSTKFYFRLRSIGDGVDYSSSGWTTEDITATTPDLTVLNAPSNIALLSTSYNKAYATFDAVEHNSGYKIRFGTTNPPTGDGETFVSGRAISSSLTAATTYYVQFKTVGDGTYYNDSEWSAAQPFTTRALRSLIVLNNNDSGTGSLRQTIAEASSEEVDTITFATSLSGAIITLASELSIAKSLNIDGSSLVSPVRISGNSACRCINHVSGDLCIYNIMITDGYHEWESSNNQYVVGCGIGGGIYSHSSGNLKLVNSIFFNNRAKGTDGLNHAYTNQPPLTEGDAAGGCVFNTTSQTTILNCVFTNNSSIGGTGEPYTEYSRGGNAYGSAIYSTDLIVANSVIYNCYNNAGYGEGGFGITGNDIDGSSDNTVVVGSLVEDTNILNNRYYDSSLPLFIDVANNDFTLAANSQAIGIGDSQYVELETDLAGNPRIQGANVDAGAYEYQPSTQLDTPTNPVATATGYNSVSLTFDTIALATGYKVRYGTSNPPTGNGAVYARGYDITGLTANTTYYIQVCAYDDGVNYADSEWSAAVSATTLLEPLAAPTNLATTTSPTSLAVTFDSVTGAVSYTLQYTKTLVNDAPDWTAPAMVETENYVSGTYLSDIVVGDTHYIRIKAVGDNVDNADSAWVETIINAPTTALDTPTGLSVTQSGTSSVVVAFTAATGASSYRVRYADSQAGLSSASDSAISIGGTISDLTANTTYYFQVRAVDLWDYTPSAWTDAVSETTDKETLATVSQPSATTISDTEIQVTFDAVTGATTYSLQYATNSTFTTFETISPFASGDSITGLTNNTTYYVRVKADDNENYHGSADWSNYGSATTKTTLTTPSISRLTIAPFSVSFTLGDISNAESYSMGLATAISDGALVSPTYYPFLTAGNKTIDELDEQETYYYQVKSLAAQNSTYADSAWSVIQSFTTSESGAPVITLSGNTTYTYEQTNEGSWVDPGYSATDEEDGALDINDDFTITYTKDGVSCEGVSLNSAGVYVITYTATDSNGKTATVSRTVTVTAPIPPTIKLYGGRIIGVPKNGAWVDPGAIAYDDHDEPAIVETASIIKITAFNDDFADCTGTDVDSIDAADTGIYRITYIASDTAGNVSDPVYRIVFVMTTNAPDVELIGDSAITFDAYTGSWTDPGVIATDYNGDAITSEGFAPNKIFTIIRRGDGEIEESVDTTMGDDYVVSYFVMDSEQNATLTNRVITILGTTLTINLNGFWEYGIVQGQPYTTPGVTLSGATTGATQSYDDGDLDVDTLGIYTETFSATDAKGNAAESVTRDIYVTSASAQKIVIKGISPDYVPLNTAYTDPDAKIVDYGNTPLNATPTKLIRKNDGTEISSIQPTMLEDYFITYFSEIDGYHAIPQTRRVLTTGWGYPTIELIGSASITIDAGAPYTDLGATAYDVKGDSVSVTTTITNRANQTVGQVSTQSSNVYRYKYEARDSRGYAAEPVYRTVTIREWQSPTIYHNGSLYMDIALSGTYNELGAWAYDEYDGTIPFESISLLYENSVGQTVSSIPTNQAGIYYAVYSYTNSHNKTATKKRAVNVYDIASGLRIELVGAEYQRIEVAADVSYTEQSVKVFYGGEDVTDDATIQTAYYFNGVETESVDCAIGVYSVLYRATYSGSTTQTLCRTLEYYDETAPVVTLLGKTVDYILLGNQYDDKLCLATDNSGETLTILIHEDPALNTNIAANYTREYYAVDSSGNESNRVSRRILVVSPTESPIATINEPAYAVCEIGASYTDNGVRVINRAGTVITPSCLIETCITNSTGQIVDSVDTSDFNTYTITYIVSDMRGFYAYPVTRTVTVVDTTAPIISRIGEEYVYCQTGETYTDDGVVVSDNYKKANPILVTRIYEGSVSPLNIVPAVSTDAPQTYIYEYTASDSKGNTATVYRTVVVLDISSPVITLAGVNPVSVEAGSTYSDAGASVTDNVDNSPTLTGSGNVDTSNIGDYSYVWTATDASGNSSTVTRSVFVRDTVAPSLVLNEPSSIFRIEINSVFEDPGATATDSFEGERPVTYEIRDAGNNVVESFAAMSESLGDYTVHYYAEDSSGNEATSVSRTVRVVMDVTPPVITIADNVEYYVYNIDGNESYSAPSASAYDAYDDATWNIVENGENSDIESDVDTATVGEYAIEYSATDTSTNTATKTLPVYVTSDSAPVITMAGDALIRVVQGSSYIDPGVSAVDSQNNSVNVTTVGTVNTSIPGVYTLKYTANDGTLPAVPKFRTVEVVPNITAVPQDATTVLLTWRKANNQSYILESSPNGTDWTEVTEYISRETSYVVNARRKVAVTANTTVYYRTKRANSTFYSEVVSTRSYAVTGLTATVTDKNTVRLEWDAMEAGTFFTIAKIDENGNETAVKVAANEFTDTSIDVPITPNILYTFRVQTSLSGLVKTTVQAGSSEITNLQVLYRSGYIKLWWDSVSGATYAIGRTGCDDGPESYSSAVSTWYNTRSSGNNGPFSYNTDYTYSVTAVREGLTPFATEISTNAKIYAFDDFDGTDYYYIGGEYGSFQKREDWSLEMLGDPLDFPPQFGENFRFCIGTNAVIDELPGAYNNVSDKGCLNIKVFDDKTVEAVSSYEQVEILHMSVDGELKICLNIGEPTFYDPVGVTKGVHLGLYNENKKSTVTARGKFELTAGSILRCYGTNSQNLVCLTDNLDTIALKIDDTAKIYANVNRQDKPFCCWLACFGWERSRAYLTQNASSPLTITNDVYVGDLMIPLNPVITGNYRRFFVENDILPSPTSKFYWSTSVINIASSVTDRTETTGTVLKADSDSKREALKEALTALAIPVFNAVSPYGRSSGTTDIVAAVRSNVVDYVVDYFLWVSEHSETWPNGLSPYKTAFLDALQAAVNSSASTETAQRSKLADDIIAGVGRCLINIENAFSSSSSHMAEQTEICLIGNNNQRIEFAQDVDFAFPIRLMKRRGLVTFVDFIGTVRGRCGIENGSPIADSGIYVDSNSRISFYEDSIISEITLYGTIFIDEDIELKTRKSTRYSTSRVEGYSRNPNKTGGYLYVTDSAAGYSDPNMYFGTWTLATHFYYVGGDNGSFLTASDWRTAGGAVCVAIPARRNGNVFHIEKDAALTGLSTSQIINPADAGEPGKISLVINGDVSIDSDVDYNHIDTIVVNSGDLILAKTSYIAFLEIYAGSLSIPKGYVRTLTFAFPANMNGGYYLDAPEPVDWDVTCRSSGITFNYSFLSGDIIANDTGKIVSTGNDIYLMANSNCQTSGLANYLYVYGQGVTITGSHKFLGIFGSVTASGSIDEIQVYEGGSLVFNGQTDSVSVFGTATLQGFADTILVDGTATVGSCFNTMVVSTGATATVNDDRGNCEEHNLAAGAKHAKNELYISGTATVSGAVQKIIVNASGTLTLLTDVSTQANNGTLTNYGSLITQGNIKVDMFSNYGDTTISSGYLRVFSSSRFEDSTVSGAGQYQLKWNQSEAVSDGAITAFVQDYDIPNVPGVYNDSVGVWWATSNKTKGATKYSVRYYDENLSYTEITDITELEYDLPEGETAEYYLVAIGNVRGNPNWTDAIMSVENERNDDGGSSDGSPAPAIDSDIIPDFVSNLKASMVNATTIRFEWDKPVVTEDTEASEEDLKPLYRLLKVRFSTDENNWVTPSDGALKISEISETVSIEGVTRLYCTVGYRDILPNTTYYAQIATVGNPDWSDSDAVWWIDTFKWIYHQWCESEIKANESPVLLAHIYRIRGESDIMRIVELKTNGFLDYETQSLVITSLLEYSYNSDDFSSLVINALDGITINERELSDGTTTTSASAAVLDVLAEEDLFIYPDPINDITSVKWSVMTVKGGFNKTGTAISGFSSITADRESCLLEIPFQDRYSRGYDDRGYNFFMEVGRQTISGTSVHPFSTSGNFIVKVAITPVVGNQIILTYNITVGS